MFGGKAAGPADGLEAGSGQEERKGKSDERLQVFWPRYCTSDSDSYQDGEGTFWGEGEKFRVWLFLNLVRIHKVP